MRLPDPRREQRRRPRFLPPSEAGSIAATRSACGSTRATGVPPAFRGGLHCGRTDAVYLTEPPGVPPAFRGGLHCGHSARVTRSIGASSSRLPRRAPLRHRARQHRRRGEGVPPAFRGGLHCGQSKPAGLAEIRRLFLPPSEAGSIAASSSRRPRVPPTCSSRLPRRAPLRHVHHAPPRYGRRRSSRLPRRAPLRQVHRVWPGRGEVDVPPAFRGGLHCGPVGADHAGVQRRCSSRLPRRAPLRHRAGDDRCRGAVGFLPPSEAGSIAANTTLCTART